MSENFKLETTTIWSFPERGKWATHESTATYRGNFAPQVARNLILRYSKNGEVVLDPFVGSGTTLIECKLLGRRGIGVDINPAAVDLCERNLQFKTGSECAQFVKIGDARNLDFVENECIDLLIVHPPYGNAIRYSENINGDLSRISAIPIFNLEIEKVAKECFRVLKLGKYCAFLIGDLRRNTKIIPLGFKTFNTFLRSGFSPKEIIVKVQHNCRTSSYWLEKSIEKGFLLLAHEYLFIFEK